jgi:hypothetical protein
VAKEKSEKQLAHEAKQAELAIFEKRVEKMSHRQLASELEKVADNKCGGAFKMHGYDFADFNSTGKKKARNRAGLDNALAAVLKIVHENTKMSDVITFKADGTPDRFARKDQIGSGRVSHFLR